MNKTYKSYKSIQIEEIEKIEIDLLLEAIYRYYGYDFRNYAQSFHSEENEASCSE